MSQSLKWCLFSLVILIFGGLACSKPEPEETVATFGVEVVRVGDITLILKREQDNYPKRQFEDSERFLDIKKRLLGEMIDRRLILLQAIKEGTDVGEEELQSEIQKYKNLYTEITFQNMLQEAGTNSREWTARKRESLILKKYLDRVASISHPISKEEVSAYYKENLESFQMPPAVRVRQIVTNSKEKAESILRRLRNGENFAKLARDLSLSPDRKKGGDLGFIVKGAFPREFEVCFSMNPGEISPIIPSAYGFHLFKVLEKSKAKTLPLTEVEGKIALILKQQAREKKREELLEELHQQTPVVVQEEILKRIQI